MTKLLFFLSIFFLPSFLWSQQVFVTGDIHGLMDYKRLLNVKNAQPGDFLIVLGDFGLVFTGGEEEKSALNQLETLPYTILFLDGNHENFPLLEKYPKKFLFGGTVGALRQNVFWLRRGEIYTLGGKTFFTFGGGYSKDKMYRVAGKNWWKEEAPSEKDKENALLNLKKKEYIVDYVLSHVPYYSLQVKLSDSFAKKNPGRPPLEPEPDDTAKFLDKIRELTEYTHWYNGHFHFTGSMDKKQTFVFQDIIKVL